MEWVSYIGREGGQGQGSSGEPIESDSVKHFDIHELRIFKPSLQLNYSIKK